MPRAPFFVSFDGIDRCGKGTQIQLIRAWLKQIGIEVRMFKEPHDSSCECTKGTPIGNLIRDILQGRVEFPGNTELQRLFTVDRAQGWHCFIKPALEAGITCLSDRYAHSTLAYSVVDGLPLQEALMMQSTIVSSEFRWPDLTILIDISPEEAIRRVTASGNKAELFEKQLTLALVRDVYLYMHHRKVGNIVVVEGERSREEVTESIKQVMRSRFDL